MHDLQRFLRDIELFSDLGEDDILLLTGNAQFLKFPDAEPIVKRGEISRFLWVVYDGDVDVTQTDAYGGRKVIASLERGQIFGEMSIMTGDPATVDVIAGHAVSLLKVPREIFSQVIARNQKTLSKFTRLITSRLLQNEKEEAKKRLKEAHRETHDPYDLDFTSVSDSLKILTVNCGSSSLKYTLFDTGESSPVIEGLIEKIGSGDASHRIRTPETAKQIAVPDVMDIDRAFDVMISTLADRACSGMNDLDEINIVGHRIVHGGQRFPHAVLIDDEVMKAIQELSALAPLHNPYNLEGIGLMRKLMPSAQQVAVFDTSFHLGMPENAHTYAIPYDICEEEHIRRYGFHGTNHKFVALSAATFLKRPLGELKIISCHLGSGASVCAIDHGQSIDTSMGFTPLEGLVMGSRGGDIDPGILLHLMRHRGMTVDEMDRMLNRQSGLLGISAKSNDMRTLLAAAEEEDLRAKRAIGTFCYRVKKYIGAYIAALGGLDVLIFTGGIGENSTEIRARICQGLEICGINIFNDLNRDTQVQRGAITDVSEPGAKVRILVIPADEEKMIAREAVHALGRTATGDDAEKLHSRPIPLSVSAHHVHLSQDDFEALFGRGRTMTPRTDLSQPGQFAAVETVSLVGPKGRIERVRILGPPRKETQIEISRTEQFKLGIDPPIRDSGDIEGTPGIIIEGEAGTIKLAKGVICAKRHIHMSPQEALGLGLRDKDVVMVKIKGVRELIFGDVLVRVHPNYRMDMHLDTDEANAARISEGAAGYIEAIQHRHYT